MVSLELRAWVLSHAVQHAYATDLAFPGTLINETLDYLCTWVESVLYRHTVGINTSANTSARWMLLSCPRPTHYSPRTRHHFAALYLISCASCPMALAFCTVTRTFLSLPPSLPLPLPQCAVCALGSLPAPLPSCWLVQYVVWYCSWALGSDATRTRLTSHGRAHTCT